MTWAHGPVVTRRRLGGELKRLRDVAGLKLDDVAHVLECSTSKISRLENGKGIPRARDVRDILDVYEVDTGEVRDRLLEWARTGQQPMWWSQYADVLPATTATYVELEWDAARIRAYESHVVHGLLQTPDYARAELCNAYGTRCTPAEIERLVDVRHGRQAALALEHGLEFECILDESTLYRVVESPATLRAQLEKLIHEAEPLHVDIRVLPFAAGLVPASREAFAKIEFSEGIEEGMVYVERTGSGGEFLADPAEIAERETALEGLRAAALTKDESIPLIERALRFLADS